MTQQTATRFGKNNLVALARSPMEELTRDKDDFDRELDHVLANDRLGKASRKEENTATRGHVGAPPVVDAQPTEGRMDVEGETVFMVGGAETEGGDESDDKTPIHGDPNASGAGGMRVGSNTDQDAPVAIPEEGEHGDVDHTLHGKAKWEAALEEHDEVVVGPAPVMEASLPQSQDEAQTAYASAKSTILEIITPWVFWVAMSCVFASIAYTIIAGTSDMGAIALLAGGVLIFCLLMLAGLLTRNFSPVLLTGVIFRRAHGMKSLDALQLAGKDIVKSLGIAEDILNVDVDARLVTTREGVVVYANESYIAIGKDAGILGTVGLPPRIDRLFAQAGPESRKIFRLCRATKSGEAAEEIITQMMGTGGKARLRRFEITVRPMRDRQHHVAWRLRELSVEDVQTTLLSAYQNYPRGVFGLERSGRIMWMNEAMSEQLGVSPNAVIQLDDIVLGEAKDVVEGLWDATGNPLETRLRQRKGGSLSVTLTPFQKDGKGEGFVCVELQIHNDAKTQDAGHLSGDMTEAPFGVAVIEGDIGTDATILEANKFFTDIFGLQGKAPLLSRSLAASAIKDLSNALKNRSASASLSRPVDVRLGEGETSKIMHIYAKPIKRRRGSYGKRRTIFYAMDVSFQKRMEEDYSQDQKLKTIGHLAGSIAHDFNNLLMVVMGSCEFLMRRHAAGDPSYPDLVLIQQNGQRAKNLTSNLLAFSRKQTLQSEVLSVTEILRDFSVFLNRAITERVHLELINGRNLPAVRADKGQLELAIMNLAVNARDAMPGGGKLRIETKLVPSDQIEGYGYAVLDQVDHVLIEVCDSGAGVPVDIADKIFEPFFTTKGEGKGTGLGLSTVYGVIGQMGGRIFLHNVPGEGATFRIFLPAYVVDETELTTPVNKTEQLENRLPQETADLSGKGRILIVEDEDGARAIIVRALQMCGYEIEQASDGDEGLEMLLDTDSPFDLVLTDIMMPEMDGPTMVTEAGKKLAQAKVIFMSGYAEASMRDKLDTFADAGYLQKPFSLKVVAAKVKEALSA